MVDVKYLKQIGTSDRSINEFREWNKKKKKPVAKKKPKKSKKPTDSLLVKKDNQVIYSYGEEKIAEFFDANGIPYHREQSFKGLLSKKRGLLRFDFWLPQYNLLIEYDGAHHFFKMNKNFKSQKDNDHRKDRWCTDNKVELMRIPYTEFNNIEEILVHCMDRFL